MKKLFLLPLMALALVACNGNKAEKDATNETPAEEAQEMNALSLNGEWRLVDYPGEENEMVIIPEDEDYVLTFNEEEKTFGMSTDCNSLGGEYKLGDDNALAFDNIACTQMACPNEQVEVAMKRILPMISSYTLTPDSTLLLRADARIMATFKYVKK